MVCTGMSYQSILVGHFLELCHIKLTIPLLDAWLSHFLNGSIHANIDMSNLAFVILTE